MAERTAKNAALFLLFYLLHLTGGAYLAYMIHFPLLALLASRALAERRALVTARSLRVLIPVALVAGAAVATIFLPYLRVSRCLGLARTVSEVRQLGATPASYFSPAPQNVYFGAATREWLRSVLGDDRAGLFLRRENSLFAGFLPTLLFVAGVMAVWRRRRPREGPPPDPWERGLAISGLICFALTFPLVYEPLMRVVPGLAGMRVPSRFYVFVSFVLAWFAARGADALLRRLPGPRARASLAAAFALVLAAELTPRPLRWVPLPREEEIPEAYRWIARDPSV